MKKALEHPFFESVRDVGLEVECESPVDLSKLNTIATMNMDEMDHFLERYRTEGPASIIWTHLDEAASYGSLYVLNGAGEQIYFLKDLGINTNFYRLLPYLITLIVLAFTSKSSRAPKAEGIPYDKGSR